MPEFSQFSEDNLSTCHEDLQHLFRHVVRDFDCRVLEGYRSPQRQEELYLEGSSQLQAGQSLHNFNPSLAVDVAPYPIDWDDLKRFYAFGGYVIGVAQGMGIDIRWGGDWNGNWDFSDQKFNDLVHFEMS